MQTTFDHQHLAALGFRGFLPVLALPSACAGVPNGSGIYAVILPPAGSGFLPRSVGGHFKGNNPTVATAALQAKWIENATTMYVGRANDLRKRLCLLARYGRGEPVAHQGGRYLWQLAAHDQLQVAWRLEEDPVRAESEFLDEFESVVGRLPFANLVRGTRPTAFA